MINDAILPTGTQYEISHGPWQAIVTEQGATLRSLHYEGTDVIKSFDADQSPTSSQGQQLLPWPTASVTVTTPSTVWSSSWP